MGIMASGRDDTRLRYACSRSDAVRGLPFMVEIRSRAASAQEGDGCTGRAETTKPGCRWGIRASDESCRLADDDCEHVARRQHEVVLAAELHLGAAVLGVDHLVADGDVERHAVAVVVDATGADRHDLALL